MKKLYLIVMAVMILSLGLSANASATTYDFSYSIDKWGAFSIDSTLITVSCPLTVSFDINSQVNLAGGDQVISAYLALDFTNDSLEGDAVKKVFGITISDKEEYASYVITEDGSVYGLGEVDDESISGLVINVGWLNDDGKLEVTVKVSNTLGTATAWLDEITLYGTAQEYEEPATSVPEPATLVLLGIGLLGLAISRRK